MDFVNSGFVTSGFSGAAISGFVEDGFVNSGFVDGASGSSGQSSIVWTDNHVEFSFALDNRLSINKYDPYYVAKLALKGQKSEDKSFSFNGVQVFFDNSSKITLFWRNRNYKPVTRIYKRIEI